RSHRSTAGSRGAAHLRTRPRFPGPLSPDLPENRQKAVRSPFSTSKNGRRKPRRRFFFLDIDREMNGPFSLFGNGGGVAPFRCDSKGTWPHPLLLIKFSPGCQQKVLGSLAAKTIKGVDKLWKKGDLWIRRRS